MHLYTEPFFFTKLGLERINRKIYELQVHVVEIKIFAAG